MYAKTASEATETTATPRGFSSMSPSNMSIPGTSASGVAISASVQLQSSSMPSA
eukprot:CAMPEP_0181263326 /NCGR_PEP_ID=MMETSP1097-20121128/2525_1 /TAXON_ID=35684 /ORGANISM="Pseudopedinella elastica, Strain CCMP716" /LENGTH=53 /DNA_ID=CAMNT_0023362115 /DNA_START=399 /DNA_END=556 /DNA_ORIENTATION=+